MLKTRYYFDLEDTMIDTFMGNERFINIPYIKNFIKKYEIKEIHIFSRAIYGEKERKHFKYNILPRIESEFGVKVNTNILTNERLKRIICKNLKINMMSDLDFFNFFGKQDSFFHLVRFMINEDIKNESFILIDDMVDDINASFFKFGCNILMKTINIRTLCEEYI